MTMTSLPQIVRRRLPSGLSAVLPLALICAGVLIVPPSMKTAVTAKFGDRPDEQWVLSGISLTKPATEAVAPPCACEEPPIPGSRCNTCDGPRTTSKAMIIPVAEPRMAASTHIMTVATPQPLSRNLYAPR